jgi:hypothetical protein
VTAIRIFDTAGELCSWLAQFPPETPVTGDYTGQGRIRAVTSHIDDELYCVAIGPVSEDWLKDHRIDTKNPRLAT